MTHTPIYQLFREGLALPNAAYLSREDARTAQERDRPTTYRTISGTTYGYDTEIRELVQTAFPMNFGALGDLDVVARYRVQFNAFGLPDVSVSEVFISGMNLTDLLRLPMNAKHALRAEVARVIEADILNSLEAAA